MTILERLKYEGTARERYNICAVRTLVESCLKVLVLATLASVIGATEQEPESARLTITIHKTEYFVGESVSVTYRVTNLSSSLLCFPPPAVDCYSIDGELAATATPPKGVFEPKTSGGCASDRWTDGDAGADLDQHWIKLGPLQYYEIEQESRYITFTSQGRWLVDGGYVPMREDTLSLYKDAMKERGCSSVPELHSEKLEIRVKRRPAK
jgi:hypothetical protein